MRKMNFNKTYKYPLFVKNIYKDLTRIKNNVFDKCQ